MANPPFDFSTPQITATQAQTRPPLITRVNPNIPISGRVNPLIATQERTLPPPITTVNPNIPIATTVRTIVPRTLTTQITSQPEVIRKLPDLTEATKNNIIALTRQAEAKSLFPPESLQEISNKLREAQNSAVISTALSNYKPTIPESAVQRRRGTNNAVEGGLTEENNNKSKAKNKVIAGANSINNQIADRAKELTELGLQKTQLIDQTEKLEGQISALSTKIANLKSANASIETIQQYEAQLETFTLLYERSNATLDRIKKLYDARYKALEKLRETRERLQKGFRKNYDKVMGVLKKFKEIPKKIKMPKRPKLPTLNLRKGNIKTKLLDSVNSIKQKTRDAAKVSVTQAKNDSQEKLRDPKKGDTFQKAASNVRNGLLTARNKLETVEAKRQALITATLGEVENQVAQARTGIISAQKQIEVGIDIAASKSTAALAKLQEAKQRAEQLRDDQLARLDSAAAQLAQKAAAGIKSAQDTLNKDIVSADLKASDNLLNANIDELAKVDELKNLVTNFLNQNNIKNFTTGVGIAPTLRGARQQAMTLDQFKQKYTEAFDQGRYDSTSRIGNVAGVYIVVTAYYQKGNVGITSMLQPSAVGGRTSQSQGTINLPAGTMGSTITSNPQNTPPATTPPTTPPATPPATTQTTDESVNLGKLVVNGCVATTWALDMQFAIDKATSELNSRGCSTQGVTRDVQTTRDGTGRSIYKVTVKASQATTPPAPSATPSAPPQTTDESANLGKLIVNGCVATTWALDMQLAINKATSELDSRSCSTRGATRDIQTSTDSRGRSIYKVTVNASQAFKPKPNTNYYVEIREQKYAWVAEVSLANPRSFQDTKFYSKSTYKTKQDAINAITNDAKSSGLVGLPPEPGFIFPGTTT